MRLGWNRSTEWLSDNYDITESECLEINDSDESPYYVPANEESEEVDNSVDYSSDDADRQL